MAARIPSARRSAAAQVAEAAPPAFDLTEYINARKQHKTQGGKNIGVNVAARDIPAYQAVFGPILDALEEEGLLTAKGEPQSRKKDAHQMAWAEFKGSAEGIAFAKQWAAAIAAQRSPAARSSGSRRLAAQTLTQKAYAAWVKMREVLDAEGGVAPKAWQNRYVVVNNGTGRVSAPGVMKTGAVQIVPGMFYIPSGEPRAPYTDHKQQIEAMRAAIVAAAGEQEEYVEE